MIVLFAIVYGEKKVKVSLGSLEKMISVWGSE